MSSINLHTSEINIKVVYYGPGLGGKTSSLQYLHRAMNPDHRGQLISLATGIDRTLYFDFLPVKLPKIKDYTIRMSLYTVPGQVHYNATRKLVLQGADGVVFVADSQKARHEGNLESLLNLKENLTSHGMDPDTVPLVMQYNKRDLPEILSMTELDSDLNERRVPSFESCAITGRGIFDTLKTITKLVLSDLKRKGIYQDRENRSYSSTKGHVPVVRRAVEQGLVGALESHLAHGETSFDGTEWAGNVPKDPSPSLPSGTESGRKTAGQPVRQRTTTPIRTFDSPRLSPKTPKPATTGISQSRPPSMPPSLQRSTRPAESGLLSVRKPRPPAAIQQSALTLSELWSTERARSEILSLESDIERGDYSDAVRRAESILIDHLARSEDHKASLAETMLELNVNGRYYTRFHGILAKQQVTRQDAVFCLFFITDIELRMQLAGISFNLFSQSTTTD